MILKCKQMDYCSFLRRAASHAWVSGTDSKEIIQACRLTKN